MSPRNMVNGIEEIDVETLYFLDFCSWPPDREPNGLAGVSVPE
jgi:hypothetical protein